MKRSKYIDHTLLKADASAADIEKLCREALHYDFASVCVNPCNVELAARILQGSDVKVCTVIGFPLGAMTPEAKAAEANDAIKRGADEVDMVLNVGRLKEHDDRYVEDEIRLVKQAVGEHTLKVILETCLLDEEAVVRGCICAKKAGADFVKTSTGFSSGGAEVSVVKLMRQTVGSDMGVKASGGIRTKEAFEAMIQAGANRIGTSSGADLVTDD